MKQGILLLRSGLHSHDHVGFQQDKVGWAETQELCSSYPNLHGMSASSLLHGIQLFQHD